MPHEERPSPAYDAGFIKLVQSALAKKRAGQKLKREEQRAIERYQRDEDERTRRRHYGQIPKKLWVQWSGRQHKILADQANCHGIPVGGETIDLPAVVKWLHDFLAENQYKLRQEEAREEDGTESGEKLRNLRLRNEQLERDAARDKLQTIDRSEAHDAFAAAAARLRAGFDQLQRRYGNDALEIAYGAIDDAMSLIDQRLGPPSE
jgi:hypothetical protein